MQRIAKQFHFSASHRLTHLPDGHQCQRLHGHNYVIEIELAGEVRATDGFIRDYNDLKRFGQWLDARVDHRHIVAVRPDVLRIETVDTPHAAVNAEASYREFGAKYAATAENLARVLFGIAKMLYPEVVACRVSETPKTWAEYRP